MEETMDKRQFLTGLGLGVGMAATAAFAQTPAPRATDSLGRSGEAPPRVIPRRKAKTTNLFLSPPGWPNAISVEPGKGFWVGEQRHDKQPEKAWLLDFKTGKVLHTVTTQCANTSGMCWGDGFLWSGANGASVINPPNPPVNGIFQTDMNSKTVTHRQIPFGPANNGGSCHGASWQVINGQGKLWLWANRLDSIIRIDPKTWQVEWMFPAATNLVRRTHGIEYSNGFVYQVVGAQDPKVGGYEGYTPGLVKYDAESGRVIEFIDFVPGSADIHDVCAIDGQLYGVDAGEHPGWPILEKYLKPGWPELNSPTAGQIVKIDLI
jgi:hypothetical protein